MQWNIKALNVQKLLENLCYGAFAALMLYLIVSGKYLAYVTPRMKPYLYFTAIVMGIWAVVGLSRILRPQHRIRSMHCFVLVLPMLLVLLPHTALGTSDYTGNYVGGSGVLAAKPLQKPYGGTMQQPQRSQVESSADDTVRQASEKSSASNSQLSQSLPSNRESQESDVSQAVSSAPEVRQSSASSPQAPAEEAAPPGVLPESSEQENPSGLPGLDDQNRRITVLPNDFSMWISEVYVNMAKYDGYTISLTGFVFKNPDILKEDEFVPARLAMTCCAADLSPMGILCKYDQAPALAAESWITVEGTLFIGQYEYDGAWFDEPQIKVSTITPAEAIEEYIYPYY